MKPLRALLLLFLSLSLPLTGMAASFSGPCATQTVSRSEAPISEHDAHAHHAMKMGVQVQEAVVEMTSADTTPTPVCGCGCLCVDHCAAGGLNAPVAPNPMALELPRARALAPQIGDNDLRPARRGPLLRPPRTA